ncbi:MAG: hypothetical protein K2H21_00340, partial [Muribaculaceae bacterium]|nr:hypothetical protein [Muribaculaceae bacterium]
MYLTKHLCMASFLTASAFTAWSPAMAAISLSAGQPMATEDFNSMWDGSAATLQLPDGWRVDRNLNAPRRVGTWDDASASVMYAGGVSLASNAKNGTWNFGADDADRAIGGLTTTVADGTRGISLLTRIDNADREQIITALRISYNIEKYRNGANAAGFQVQLFISTDGVKWTSAGDEFLTSFDPDSETAGAAVVPISTVEVADRFLRTHVEPGAPLYLAWNISVASGTTPDKAPGLAIDDIRIEATFAESDPDWTEPETPEINHSGIYMRGVDGWDPTDEWEFNKLSDTLFELRDKKVSGSFKIADADWSSSCNYGSNGTSILMSEPYVLKAGTDDNISCGGMTFDCARVVLSIENGTATLLLEPNEDMSGLTSVYMVGDFNGWNYMDRSGELTLDESTGSFSGRVTMQPGADGMSHWCLYQRLGMAGVWGLEADATAPSPLEGKLSKGATGYVATPAGTYDITISLNEDGIGSYTLTAVEAVATDLTVNPQHTVLVPGLPDQVRVLSLNNSLIHYNDQSAMFNDIALSMRKDAEWTKHTLLGKSLATHWNEGDGMAGDGLPGAKMMVRSQPWSHIILQEQSSLPRTDPSTFRDNVARWVEYIREACPNPNAVIILPVNWAYAGDWSNFTSFNDIFLNNYREVADEFGVVLCPVMNAYQMMYDAEGAEGLAPWFQDDRHPTDMSTYMAACMEYGLIFGEDPASISYHPASVSVDDAEAMRAYASAVLGGFTQSVNHHEATVAVSAEVTDAFGLVLPQEDVRYSVSDGAEISADGVFHATAPGEYTVTVSAAGFERSATVTVAEAVTEMPYNPAIPLSADAPAYSQDFDSMGDAADAALPEGWRIDRTDAPRATGLFLDAALQTTYAGGPDLPSNAKNGVWNFGPDATDRAVGGITTGVAGGTRAVNVYAHFINDGVRTLSSIDLAYDVEKYRDGNNAAGFSVQLYTSVDGRSWSPAGSDFNTVFPASAATAGASVVPIETKSVSASLPVGLRPGCDLYLAWNISVSSGSECQGAPALAIDNVSLSAVAEEIPTYDWYIFVEDNTGYDALGLYAYGDKEIWGAWPGQAPIDTQVIEGIVYKVFGHNEASGSYNIILNNWNRSLQLPDYPVSGGRNYYFSASPEKLTELFTSGLDEVRDEAAIHLSSDSLFCCDASRIEVYSVAGTVAARAESDTISISTLPAGTYIAVATTGDSIAT